MKKFVSLFLSLALLLAFCGCTSKSPDTTDNTPKNCLYYCNYSVFTS